MKRLHTLLLALTVAAASWCTTQAPAAAQTSYSVRDLGLLPGTNTSMGTDVNDNGEVVGDTAYSGTYKHSFYWSASAGMVDMGAFVQFLHINNLGQVISRQNGGSNFVWKYGENGNRLLVLPGLRTGGSISTSDINPGGEIIGRSDTNVIIGYDTVGAPQYATVAALWKKVVGVWTPFALPMPPGDNRGGAHQLTNIAADGTGQAVGVTGQVTYVGGNSSVTVRHFVRWTRSGDNWFIDSAVQIATGIDLGNLNAAGDSAGGDSGTGGGAFVDSANSVQVLSMGYVMGIDGAGNAAGTATLPEGKRAVRRDRLTGNIVSLGTLGGNSSMTGEYYNDNTNHVMSENGRIVGSSGIAGSTTLHGFIWDPVNAMRDLNSTALTPNKATFSTLLSASAISNFGHITGLGGVKKGGGYSHAFLLTPQ